MTNERSLFMASRRTFIKHALGGSAALAAYGLFPAARVLGANDRVRIGLIGAGGRGQEIFKAALQCPNVEGVAVADVYTRRLDEVKGFVPNIKTYGDLRQLLEDKSVDAVLIATPQHQHALSFVPAVQAGKDIYQEKTMAFNPDHAKRMRKALEGAGRIVQVGIQSTSGPAVERVREYLSTDKMGVITQLHTHHYRNAPYGGWKRKIPADCNPQHVNWKAFQGEAKEYAFDPNRVMNWRFYYDYSGGNVFENMVHQVGFWYGALGWNIPEAVTMAGADYLAPQMHVPDTMSVTMQQPEKVLFTWNSMFGNAYFGEGYDLLFGNTATLIHDQGDNVALLPQRRRGSQAAAAAP